jgi:hypothetical protein
MYAFECNPASCHQYWAQDGGRGVSHSDELEDETELSELPNILPNLLLTHAGLLPVETGRQVVSEPVTRSLLVDTLGELLGLSVDGRFGLHPQQVGIRGESDGSVDGTRSTSLVPVVTLSGSRCIPVEEGDGLEAKLLLGDLQSGRSAEMTLGESGVELGNLGVGDALGLEGIGQDDGEGSESGLGGPLVFDLLKGWARLALELGSKHEVVEGQ